MSAVALLIASIFGKHERLLCKKANPSTLSNIRNLETDSFRSVLILLVF